MTDAAGIAAITAGATLIASASSGTLSYLAARRSTGVQLAAVEGEMERLRTTHEEEERRQRKDLYVEFLNIVNRNGTALAGSGRLDREIYERQAEEFSLVFAKMLLVATESVAAEMEDISDGFRKAGAALAKTDGQPDEFANRARKAFEPHGEAIFLATGKLIGAMKHDLIGERFVAEILAESRDQKT